VCCRPATASRSPTIRSSERARNIVAGLIGNYNIQSLDAREPGGPQPPAATKRPTRTVDQLDLLDQVEKRAERQNGGRPARA